MCGLQMMSLSSRPAYTVTHKPKRTIGNPSGNGANCKPHSGLCWTCLLDLVRCVSIVGGADAWRAICKADSRDRFTKASRRSWRRSTSFMRRPLDLAVSISPCVNWQAPMVACSRTDRVCTRSLPSRIVHQTMMSSLMPMGTLARTSTVRECSSLLFRPMIPRNAGSAQSMCSTGPQFSTQVKCKTATAPGTISTP